MSAQTNDQVINTTPDSVIEYQYSDIGFEAVQGTHNYQRNPAYNVVSSSDVSKQDKTAGETHNYQRNLAYNVVPPRDVTRSSNRDTIDQGAQVQHCEAHTSSARNNVR